MRNITKDFDVETGQAVRINCGPNHYDGIVTARTRTGHRVEVEMNGTTCTFTRRRSGYYIQKGTESVYLYIREAA